MPPARSKKNLKRVRSAATVEDDDVPSPQKSRDEEPETVEDEPQPEEEKAKPSLAEQIGKLAAQDVSGYVNLFQKGVRLTVAMDPATGSPTFKMTDVSGKETLLKPKPTRGGRGGPGRVLVDVVLPPMAVANQFCSLNFLLNQSNSPQSPYSGGPDAFFKSNQTMIFGVDSTLQHPKLRLPDSEGGGCVSEDALMRLMSLFYSAIPAEANRAEDHIGGLSSTAEASARERKPDDPELFRDWYGALYSRLNDPQKSMFTPYRDMPKPSVKQGKDAPQFKDGYTPDATDFTDTGAKFKASTRLFLNGKTNGKMDSDTTAFLAGLPDDEESNAFRDKVADLPNTISIKPIKLLDENGTDIGPEKYDKFLQEIGEGSIGRSYGTLSISASAAAAGSRIDYWPKVWETFHREGGYSPGGSSKLSVGLANV
jgi:hypothetical protein